MSGFWPRVRKGRLAQVLVVYLGLSWVLLQVVSELREALELPPWIGPVALILLAIGLMIVLATAWVQSHPLIEHRARAEDVPGAWEVDLADLTSSVARGRLPHLTWSRAILGGIVAFSLLFGLAGLVVVLRDRGAFTPEEAIADEAASAVAVLPFSVSGPEMEFWREGMVDALSTSLDGLAGLRAIDSRTVLARWREAAPGEEGPDLEKALQAAGQTGARFAVLGSIVSTGRHVQLAADVYDVEAGRKLGSARADGSADADSTFALVDRLTLEMLQVVPRPEGTETPPVELAALTTRSVEALRAYLEGETYFRRTDWRPAIAAYERAVELDSTFALAHYRLSLAYGWADFEGGRGGHDLAAVRFSDRLPERDRLLVRGHLDFQQGLPERCLETLEEVTLKYPDEVEAWYLLGECQLHFGVQMLRGGIRWSEEAFRRASELDPGFRPAVIHLADIAWENLDTAWIAQLHREHASEEWWATGSELALWLAFGDSTERAAARAALDTVAPPVAGQVFYLLRQPPLLPLQEQVLAEFRGRASWPPMADPPDAVWRARNAVSRGQLEEAVRSLSDGRIGEDTRRLNGLGLHTQDLPVREDALEEILSLRAADSLPDLGSFAALAYAADREGTKRQVVIERWRRMADSLHAVGDTARAGWLRGMAAAQEGYGRWRAGDREGALRLLQFAQGGAIRGWAQMAELNALLRLWIGQLLLELERPEDAARYLRSVSDMEPLVYPVTWLRLAEIHDAAGQQDQAAEWYAKFTEVWAEADPELQPMVERARTRLTQILAERG